MTDNTDMLELIGESFASIREQKAKELAEKAERIVLLGNEDTINLMRKCTQWRDITHLPEDVIEDIAKDIHSSRIVGTFDDKVVVQTDNIDDSSVYIIYKGTKRPQDFKDPIYVKVDNI